MPPVGDIPARASRLAPFPSMAPSPILLSCFMALRVSLKRFRSSFTAPTACPAPRATRRLRLMSIRSGWIRSLGVMEVKRASRRFIWPSSTSRSASCPMPGIMPMTFFMGPNLRTMRIIENMSSRVKEPITIFSTRYR